MKLKIKVTEEHIKTGGPSSLSKCPIALAFKDLGILVSVGYYGIYEYEKYGGPPKRVWTHTPETKDWILTFDAKKPVGPIEFELDAEPNKGV